MKMGVIITLLLLVILVGCTKAEEPLDAITNEQPTIEDPNTDEMTIETSGVADIKEFDMTAKKWDFEPSEINVNLGDEIILHIKSIDVSHGISIPDFNINENLEPGQNIDIRFTANKVGEFRFYCNVFCGSGHGHMEGAIIVT